MKYFLFLLVLGLSSCSNNNKYEELDKYWWIYKKARAVGDDATAINAVYEIMYLDSNEYIYYDSIAVLYFEMGEFNRCLEATRKSLRFHTYPPTIKFGFKAAKTLSRSKDVIIFGELLLESEPSNLNAMYDVAVHSLQVEQLEEAKAWIDRLLANPNSTIVMNEQIQNDNSSISIPLSVSATNLAGVYYWQTGQPGLAKQMFQKAVSRVPEYDVAKDNLQQLNALLKNR